MYKRQEYTFFILQPILAGLWLLFLLRRLPLAPATGARPYLRWIAVAGAAIIWLPSVVVLVSGWPPGTYMALILAWALPPIMLQFAFGADILWRHRRLLALAIIPVTLFLSAADSLAIGFWGIWTIDPQQSLNIYLGGILPLEEFVFFLMTNILLVFGVTLFLSTESHARFNQLRGRTQSNQLPAQTLEKQPK